MIRLYYYPLSPFARKVRVALEEKQLSFERIFVNLARGEQHGPEYLRLNPHGRVPALADGNVVLYESAAIIEYLEERYPEVPLLPEGAAERARVRALQMVSDSRFSRMLGPLLFERIAENRSVEEQMLVERAHDSVKWHLEWLEAELTGREWLVDGFSVADVAFGCSFETLLRYYEMPERYSSLWDWLRRLRARPTWKYARSIPMIPRHMRHTQDVTRAHFRALAGDLWCWCMRTPLPPACCQGCGLPLFERPATLASR
jgi:glutathione S-transferase